MQQAPKLAFAKVYTAVAGTWYGLCEVTLQLEQQQKQRLNSCETWMGAYQFIVCMLRQPAVQVLQKRFAVGGCRQS
jgi:hypothetical protein